MLQDILSSRSPALADYLSPPSISSLSYPNMRPRHAVTRMTKKCRMAFSCVLVCDFVPRNFALLPFLLTSIFRLLPPQPPPHFPLDNKIKPGSPKSSELSATTTYYAFHSLLYFVAVDFFMSLRLVKFGFYFLSFSLFPSLPPFSRRRTKQN